MVRRRLPRPLRETVTSPALLALCGLIGLLEVGTWLVVAPFLADASRPALVGWILLQRLLLVCVLAAVLPGCYATAREGLGLRGAVRATLGRLDTATPRLLTSLLVSRVLVVAMTAVGFLVGLTGLGVLDTASVWTSAAVGFGLDRPVLALVGVPAVVVGASWLARGAVGLHDLRAIDGTAGPGRPSLWSLGAWRGRRRRLVAYAVVRGTLLSLPIVVALLVVALLAPGTAHPLVAHPPALAQAAVASVATTALARSALVSYQLAKYDSLAAETVTPREPTPQLVPRSRGALLAAVVVLAALVGVGTIRTLDVQPAPEPAPGVTPADATGTIETAIERTGERDLITEQQTAVWNESAAAWTPVSDRAALLQRSDRSVRYYADGPGGDDRTIYATDGRLAMLHASEPPAAPHPLHLRLERGSWHVIVGHACQWGTESQFGFPPPDADWELTERSEDTLVYAVRDPQSLADHGVSGIPDVPAESAAVGEATGARIIVDRRLVTVRRATVTVVYAGDGGDGSARAAQRWQRVVSKTGNVTASRPGSVGKPSLPARLWDVVYY
jgi:hypothetical protein